MSQFHWDNPGFWRYIPSALENISPLLNGMFSKQQRTVGMELINYYPTIKSHPNSPNAEKLILQGNLVRRSRWPPWYVRKQTQQTPLFIYCVMSVNNVGISTSSMQIWAVSMWIICPKLLLLGIVFSRISQQPCGVFGYLTEFPLLFSGLSQTYFALGNYCSKPRIVAMWVEKFGCFPHEVSLFFKSAFLKNQQHSWYNSITICEWNYLNSNFRVFFFKYGPIPFQCGYIKVKAYLHVYLWKLGIQRF